MGTGDAFPIYPGLETSVLTRRLGETRMLLYFLLCSLINARVGKVKFSNGIVQY